ncbi:MAG: DUF3267 domain-containing protein [Oscillospiraceae bacterium]|nr:DUF3267 domain-containing protein [Oscillospiraceae bacterium]
MKERKITGNRDEKEKSRELTPAEEKRLLRFEELSDRLIGQGYRRVELTVSIVKANIFAVVLLIPLLIAGGGLFFLRNHSMSGGLGKMNPLLFAALFFAMIVVHELIHGLSWSLFAENRWKDIEFGFMKQYLTPYCTCAVPLGKGAYIFGALMPLVLLGILPMIVGILADNLGLLLLGVILADAAAGDILIVWKILRYRSEAGTVVYIDHPTQAGGVIFEK